MRKFTLLPLAFAAVMAVALPGAPSAQAALSSATLSKILGEQLPTGVTLAKANCSQTAKAVSSAAQQHPDLVRRLVQAAVMARTPKQGQGDLPCECLTKIVSAGINAVPSQSSEIVQMALSMHPECADSLNALVNTSGNGPDGYNTPQDLYGGFGIGFGPGFPGSPGFTGSPPSGAIALPPVAVTNDRNG